ncbi:hypothetical protein COO60DRAFT_545657 [Scenedesmus sp. NREL 46B-D3]|nr:hypothetical protein COO60DRAFT_545657 [Scenedesmus sp. NREL 46B-D3]
MMQLMAGWQQQEQQAGLDSSSRQPYSDAQRQKLQQAALSWLQMPDDADSSDGSSSSSMAQLPLSSVRQLRELLLAFKAVTRQQLQRLQPSSSGSETPGCQAAASGQWCAAGASSRGPAGPSQPWQQQQQQQQQPGVGDTDDDHSSLAMAAPDGARPSGYGLQQAQDEAAGPGPGSARLQQQQQQWQQHTPGAVSSSGLKMTCDDDNCVQQQQVRGAGSSSAELLEVYRSGPGAERAALVNDNHSRLKAARRRARELAQALNTCKLQLDEARGQQEQARQARLALALEAQETLGPQEYELLLAIRDIKAEYRDMHAALQLARDEVQYTSGLLDTCRAELAADFQQWSLV